jgi:hypothetical protein
MVRVLLLSCSLIVASMPTQVQAKSRSLGEFMSECGFGSVFSPDDQGTAQVINLLSTLTFTGSSIYFSPSSFVLSSTTSANLLVCNGAEATAAAIIHNSYEQLEVELAAGEGPYLSLLSSVVIGKEQSDKAFISVIRRDFRQYVGTPEFSSHKRLDKEEKLFDFVMRQ